MNETISYLFSRQNLGIKLGLDRTIALMGKCGNPHKRLPCIQIVGTNGKGSTAAFLANILHVAGYKTGLSTSPHFVNVNERIRINNEPIHDDVIIEFVKRQKNNIEEFGSSFFEIITAMGFWYFDQANVDIAILETGLGGRLDSVSVCKPFATVITPISLDHVEILGNTLSKIAFEKAGALKSNVPCYSAVQKPEVRIVLENIAKQIGTSIIFVDKTVSENYTLGLAGDHQRINASLAIETASKLESFHVSENDLKTGLETVKWHGRNQVLQNKPLVIFDVGHNEEGIKSLLNEVSQYSELQRKYLILSLSARKDISNVIEQIESYFDYIICTETNSKRSMKAEYLHKLFNNTNKIKVIKNPLKAITSIVDHAHEKDIIVIAGTHYLGEAVKKYYKFSFNRL